MMWEPLAGVACPWLELNRDGDGRKPDHWFSLASFPASHSPPEPKKPVA